ncbi:brevican core protein [Hippocampus comes]|uniref:brevican core protein n=1 Tax=Hippocampus comes TaxID=109280 RepID=UPI00094F0F44|nr:PREDICTED: brevican core protein-like [Hippocampus comes]
MALTLDLELHLNRMKQARLSVMLAALTLLVLPLSSTTQPNPDGTNLLHVTITSGPKTTGELGATLTLPCLASLARPPPGLVTNGRRAALSLPHIRWSLVGRDDDKETEILVARGDSVQVSEVYRGRASLPHYAVSPANLTLRLEGLRHSDAGEYRCHVQQGLDHGHDVTQVQVKGLVFHHGDLSRSPHAFTFERAREACVEIGAQMAMPEQLEAAYHSGYEHCNPGWLSDRSVRYAVQKPREDCLGVMEGLPGVRTFGTLEPEQLFDVYCFVGHTAGEVFHGSAPRGFTFGEAKAYCLSEGAELATLAQLYAARNDGLSHCGSGWLKDGSVRHPMPTAGVRCGEEPGNKTDFPEAHRRQDVYCFRTETTAGNEEVQTVHSVTQDPLKTESWTTVDPQLAPELFMTKATFGSEDLSSPSEEHQNTSTADASTGNMALTSSHIEEPRSFSTVSPTLETNKTFEDHPQPGEAIRMTDSLVTMETNAITSTESPLESSEELSGVASVTPGTPVIQTVEVATVTDFSFDRTAPPLTSGIPSNSTHTFISDTMGHLEATDKDGEKAKTETPAKASSDWSGESPEAKPKSASNLTDSPDHHTDPRTPPPSETISSPLEESGFHMESNNPLLVAWNEATRTIRRPEGGQEKNGTDVVSVQKCSGCHLKDQTMETVTDATVVREEPTLAMAAKQEVIQDLCGQSPCLNGGTCLDGDTPKCICLPGYGGASCQSDLKACEAGWEKFQSFCYHHVNTRQSWEGAEQHCRTIGGHLMSIMTPEEQHHVNDKYKEYQWIGLNDKTIEGDFRWSDGNLLIYDNWHRGQPDSYFLSGEDCAAMVWHDGGRWSDVPCNYHLSFTCKKGLSSCGEPPAVANAMPFGKTRTHYETFAKVRYRCHAGFMQKLNPIISCLPNGRWEEPLIMCLPAASPADHRFSSTARPLSEEAEEVTAAVTTEIHTQSSSPLSAH